MFSSNNKLWKVGKHRIKKIKRLKKRRQGRHSHTEKVTRVKCVDCERVMKTREKFENSDLTCYDVIRQ